MTRPKEQVQRNGNRWRMVAYHVGSSKPAYVYVGRDEARAKRLAPYLRTAIDESPTLVEAQEAVNHLLAGRDDADVRRRAGELLSRRLVVCVPESDEEVTARLESEGTPHEMASDPDIVAQARRKPQTINGDYLARHPEAYPDAVGALLGIPDLGDKVREEQAGACPEKLSDLLTEWQSFKGAEGLTGKHLTAYAKIWGEFTALIGNKPTNRLARADFARWQKHLLETQGQRGPKWFNDRLKPIGAIIRHCRSNKCETEFQFPEGITDWIDFSDCYKPHKPHPSNARPLPVAVFTALLHTAQNWAELDPQAYAEKMPAATRMQRANNLKQAIRIQRAGVQWAGILIFAIQTGADNSDICNLEWSHIHTGGRIPYVEMSRSKTDEYRRIPLLRTTVASLERWRQYEPGYTKTVFRNDGKRPFVAEKVAAGFQRLRKATPNGSGSEWCFKHLRNTAVNMAKSRGVPEEQREAFLGHARRGMNVFYEQSADETFLLDMVRMIGEVFLGE